MTLNTKVGIIGAGPAGLTLALMLQRSGIRCVILENRSRDYVESRVRAGSRHRAARDSARPTRSRAR